MLLLQIIYYRITIEQINNLQRSSVTRVRYCQINVVELKVTSKVNSCTYLIRCIQLLSTTEKLKCEVRGVDMDERGERGVWRSFPRSAVAVQRVSVWGPSAWRCVTRRCEAACKTTEIGTGHRQQHTWRVSLCFLTVSALSVWLCVCVGWRWRRCECVSIPLYFWKPHGMKQHVHLHTWHRIHGGLSVTVSIHKPPRPLPSTTTTHTCTHILQTKTHNFLQAPLTHALIKVQHYIWYQF